MSGLDSDIPLPEEAMLEPRSESLPIVPVSGFYGPMVTITDCPFWYYIMLLGGVFSSGDETTFDNTLTTPVLRGSPTMFTGFDLLLGVSYPSRFTQASRAIITTHLSYVDVEIESVDIVPSGSEDQGSGQESGQEPSSSSSRHWICCIGVYNGEPVYKLGCDLSGGSGTCYLFRSVKRRRFVLSESLKEPYAYCTASYSTGTAERSLTMHGDGWYEQPDESTKMSSPSGSFTGSFPSEGPKTEFYAAGRFLQFGANLSVSRKISLSPVFAGWVCKGGFGSDRKTFVRNAMGSTTGLFHTDMACLQLGVWVWDHMTDDGRVDKRVMLSPYSSGYEAYYPDSVDCRPPEEGEDDGAFADMVERNMKKPPAFRTQVFLSSGGAVDCRDACGNPVTEWVVKKNRCGAWVVNLSGSSRRGFRHRVVEGQDLYAEYIFGYGLGDDVKSLGLEKCLEEFGILDAPEIGRKFDDIVFKWNDDLSNNPAVQIQVPGFVKSSDSKDDHGDLVVVFE